MDKTIRRNEVCVIGQPQCDFVFSSTRSCFIAYGFEESPLEMNIIRRILKDRGIEPIEAAGNLAPAQNAFCAKICSKIITSQFCVVLLNNDKSEGTEIPNANVNMEYGVMLGFNKSVIPFQHETQKLPFNVAGLDTVKYTNKNFEEKATAAIDQAINDTQQDAPPKVTIDQVLHTFLMSKKALMTPLNNEGEKNIFQLGSSLDFYLLNDFGAMNFMFLGNFINLRQEIILWRIKLLIEIITERQASLESRVQNEFMTETQSERFIEFINSLQIWVIVTSNEDKDELSKSLENIGFRIEIFSLNDMDAELAAINIPVNLSNSY